MSLKRGRPTLTDPRIVVIRVRLTHNEKTRLDEIVDRTGFTQSDFIRRRVFGLKIVPRIEEKWMDVLRQQGTVLKDLKSQEPGFAAQLDTALKEVIATLQTVRSSTNGGQ